MFQVGRKQWRIQDDFEFTKVRLGKYRQFFITQNQTTIFGLKYRALDRDWDVAFDNTDLDEIDFSHGLPSWRVRQIRG